MNNITYRIVTTSIIPFLAGCAPASNPPASPFGNASQVELFAPHLWDAGEEVHAGTFAGDGRSFYFFKKVGPEDFRIVVSHWEAGEWSAPVRLPFSDTTSDLYPAISADGQRMVFTSYRHVPGDTLPRRNGYLWEVARVGDAWGTPRPLMNLNTMRSYHPGPKLLADGTLYFRVISRDDRANMRAAKTSDGWANPERMVAIDALQSDSVRVWGAEPSPDERMLFLTVARRTADGSGFGPGDVYVMKRHGEGGWSQPEKLNALVNTDAAESAAVVTPDNRHLVFSRSGRLYVVSLAALGI